MTNKELQEELKKYPDSFPIHVVEDLTIPFTPIQHLTSLEATSVIETPKGYLVLS